MANPAPPPRVVAAVDIAHPGLPIARHFLGLSIEYGPTVENMVASRDAHCRSLAKWLNLLGRYNGSPVLRIGGNSEDMAAWNLPALKPAPPGVTINITPEFCRDIRKLCHRTRCKLILGVNLGRGSTGMAKTWVAQALKRIGEQHILAFEIGNEADAYVITHQRPAGYTLAHYEADFTRFSDAIEPLMPRPGMIAGPAFSCFWLKNQTADLIAAMHRRLGLVTIHDYPLGVRRAIPNPHSPRYDSIANLLKNSSASLYRTMAAKTIPAARRYHLPVRWAEINSAAGGGDAGISDSFASALWLLDTLFEAAKGGAVGVNLHNAGAQLCPYATFCYDRNGQLVPHPDFYAMLMFAMAARQNSRLVPAAIQPGIGIKAWATCDSRGTVRIVLINKRARNSAVSVAVKLAGYGRAALVRLTAPSLASTRGITLARCPLGSDFSEPVKPNGHITPQAGIYTAVFKRAGAALLTLRPTVH